MGQAYARNVALWGALAHECSHNITLADNGLLNECADKVYSDILNTPEFQGHMVTYNGIQEPFVNRAAEVWKFWIVETVVDVMGFLNFGPASAIAFASLIIPFRNGRLLVLIGQPNDPHPINALELFWLQIL